MKISIRSRLILSFVGVIALVLVCQLVFNVFFATSYYRAYQENMMYKAYEELQTEFDGSLESIEEALYHYENSNNFEAYVWVSDQVWYTSYDRMLYSVSGSESMGSSAYLTIPNESYITGKIQQVPQESMMGMMQNSSGASVQADSMSQGGQGTAAMPNVNNSAATMPQDGQSTGDAPSEGGEVALVPQEEQGVSSKPLEGDVASEAAGNETDILRLVGAFDYDGETVIVALATSLESIESSADVFTRSSMVISVIALAIGLMYSLILSKSITKPITEMDRIAGQFANLDFSHKANENVSSTELYRLSCSLNSMSTQLEKSIAALSLANDQLQEDIDYQKRMEQMRREFMGNVSHEMKTPLTMLQIYAESLKDNVESVDKDYYCHTIIEETETLNDLVASMLDISSIESGLSKMQMDTLDLSELLQVLVERMQPLLIEHEVSVDIMPDLTVIGDEKYLVQAMKNFITNAIEHTKPEGNIRISMQKDGEGICYSVENAGRQIADEDMPQLWDSFYRSDKARSRGNKNVGLGLHIVKTVVDKHEGSCHCENTADGVRFSFWLPDRVLPENFDE